MILIVDDSPENIISLKKVLEKNDFEVDTAASGEEALKKILKKSYVLIILDVQMPGMDGFEVAEAISGYSKAKETAIIFLSAATANVKLITRGYSSGGLDYISKPVDMNILLLKVKTFYRIYEQSRALNEMQMALREEIEFRKEAERKKDEFISIASHELKTPMTSIKGYIQLLERSLDKDDKETIRKRLHKVQNQIDKLNILIADLLDISKIESGKLKFNKKHFQFDDLLDHLIEIMQQSNPQVKILKNANVNGTIFGDEMRLEQVIINFITNAIKYGPDGKEIQITSEIRGNEVYFSVRDYGIGMSNEHLQKVFDKFYRIEETSERFQGLGIGLYICKEIIERHHGEIGVDSTIGEGSEFYFKIPLNPKEGKNKKQYDI
ncbi:MULTISPECIES: hybrid sensor histidine kinase/response regulator [unclassified Kaistella]|uniref:ATP-binding response regulator n=1 Tax=unclassified Kaistella TaxID=2762626 RepID=UPI0027360D59|nr:MULTISPECIES: hybrid sensor histidine kinase/response regulator [unclassified Kaistella]MCZ2085484.1 hybrid sensor histidine kinase/response regulator [Flavobacteriales bacterium]MDP2453538.1 hybrid sensor histidine kinase/response regulator [Kaistella sp. SH11-4b]MDP2456595.1 hybrid sensor histidine kinase/response regulator [Kaistella sp. SH40-3]MDP2459351.1 hybrid sensor histidine kinase/response regulator [Kaistella sp. SH19-2b]